MTPRDPPDVFEYDELTAFLEDSVEHLRKRAGWSIGAWAKHLQLAQTSSLSRVVKGERVPSVELTERLVTYFGLEGIAAEYLRCLVSAKRVDALDATTAGAIRTRQRELQIARLDGPSRSPHGDSLLHIEEGKMVVVWFAAEEARVRPLLEPHGMDVLPMGGRAIFGVQCSAYSDTTFGAYDDLALVFTAYPRGGDPSQGGLFYDTLYTSNLRLATYGRMIWGNDYKRARLDVRIDEASATVRAADAGARPIARIDAAFPEGRTLPYVDESELYGASANSPSQSRFRMVLRMHGIRMEYDPALHVCDFPPESVVGQAIAATSAEPLQLVLYRSVRADLFAPELLRNA